MLVDFVLLSLGCAQTYFAVTAAPVFVYDITLSKGRHRFYVDCSKDIFGGKLSSEAQLLCGNYLPWF